MIRGIGIDIVQNERIKRVAQRWGDKFLKRIFTDGELAYCMRHNPPYPQLAARFAAKEAVIKARGGAFGLTLKDIEVASNEAGKPYIQFAGPLAGIVTEFGTEKFHLTLTHERDYSVAFVVIESV